MSRKTHVGCVLIHPTGTNPYNRETANPYRYGNGRVQALREFKATGKWPEGFTAWDDRDKVAITSIEQVDWSGMS